MAIAYKLAKNLLDQFPEIDEPTRSRLIDAISQTIEGDRRATNSRVQFLLGNYSALTGDALEAIRRQIENSLYEGR